jgi:predicted dehydrogenase
MEKLGIALVGLDHWYSALDTASRIGLSDQVRLVAVADDDQARAQEVAREHDSSVFVTTDYRAAIGRPDVDIVVAFYSTDRNVEVCTEAAGQGKHLTSVKPMALDLAGADAIGQAVKQAGVHFFPFDCLLRLDPGRQRLRKWIQEGRIGQPLRFTQTLNSSLPMAWRGTEGQTWWTDPKRTPGGGWIDHAIYAIDTVRWLFDTEPVSVRGVVANMRYPDLGMEDYGASTFSLANGAVALIEDTWTADRGFGFSRNEIIGSQGAIADDAGVWGRIAARGNFGFDGWVMQPPVRDEGISVVDHLAACIRGEAAPVATWADGRANLAACLGFYQAAKSNTIVEL